MSRALRNGILAAGILLAVYFSLIYLISGGSFLQNQFKQFWYYTVTLAIGFGIQVGLFSFVKSKAAKVSPGVVAASGITSTGAMISCCTHYLINLLPILGVAGIITIVSQYQIQLFWIGLAFNFAGIIYMANKVFKLKAA